MSRFRIPKYAFFYIAGLTLLCAAPNVLAEHRYLDRQHQYRHFDNPTNRAFGTYKYPRGQQVPGAGLKHGNRPGEGLHDQFAHRHQNRNQNYSDHRQDRRRYSSNLPPGHGYEPQLRRAQPNINRAPDKSYQRGYADGYQHGRLNTRSHRYGNARGPNQRDNGGYADRGSNYRPDYGARYGQRQDGYGRGQRDYGYRRY